MDNRDTHRPEGLLYYRLFVGDAAHVVDDAADSTIDAALARRLDALRDLHGLGQRGRLTISDDVGLGGVFQRPREPAANSVAQNVIKDKSELILFHEAVIFEEFQSQIYPLPCAPLAGDRPAAL